MKQKSLRLVLVLVLLISVLISCTRNEEPADEPLLPPIHLADVVGKALPPTGEIRYFGTLLSDAEQNLYALIIPKLDELAEEFSFSETDFAAVDRVWNAILADYPEFFWLSGVYQRGIQGFPSRLWIKPEYIIPVAEIPEQRRQAELICDDILNRAEGMTDYERALFFHDYIVTNTSYDLKTSESSSFLTSWSASRSAYGCLVNHLAVCSGYAKAFQWLAQSCGMECLCVNGSAKNDNIGHEWNCVRLNGDYYYIDITWDDPVPEDGDEETVAHEYFCISTEELLQTHNLADGQSIPVCSATECDYYRMRGLYFEEYDEAQVGEVAVGRGVILVALEEGLQL